MRTSVKYNTKIQMKILATYLYLIDSHEITFEIFKEEIGGSSSMFSRVMKYMFDAVEALKLKCTMFKVQQQQIFTGYNITYNKYYFQMIGHDYSCSLENLSEEQLIRYSMLIVYLLIKNNVPIRRKTLRSIFPYYDKNKNTLLINRLKQVIAEDIIRVGHYYKFVNNY